MGAGRTLAIIIAFLRWLARITGIVFAVLLLLFLFGEGSFPELLRLDATEKLLLLFIPLLFIIGVIVAWKRELPGGILILISVLGFNIIDFFIWKQFAGIEFGFLLIPGVLFLLVAWLAKKPKDF